MFEKSIETWGIASLNISMSDLNLTTPIDPTHAIAKLAVLFFFLPLESFRPALVLTLLPTSALRAGCHTSQG